MVSAFLDEEKVAIRRGASLFVVQLLCNSPITQRRCRKFLATAGAEVWSAARITWPTGPWFLPFYQYAVGTSISISSNG